MAHLVDGLQIHYQGNEATIYDGEGKPIIYSGKVINKEILEEFIWLYKLGIEHYKGTWRDMFADELSYEQTTANKSR